LNHNNKNTEKKRNGRTINMIFAVRAQGGMAKKSHLRKKWPCFCASNFLLRSDKNELVSRSSGAGRTLGSAKSEGIFKCA
jgi:hypothetical protein